MALLAAVAALPGFVQALAPTPAAAMVAQESSQECDEADLELLERMFAGCDAGGSGGDGGDGYDPWEGWHPEEEWEQWEEEEPWESEGWPSDAEREEKEISDFENDGREALEEREAQERAEREEKEASDAENDALEEEETLDREEPGRALGREVRRIEALTEECDRLWDRYYDTRDPERVSEAFNCDFRVNPERVRVGLPPRRPPGRVESSPEKILPVQPVDVPVDRASPRRGGGKRRVGKRLSSHRREPGR